jgi:hypothetical protein
MSLRHKPLAYGIRKPQLKKIAKANPNLSQKDIEKIITKILEEVKVLVVRDLRSWIKKFVPKMTGRLRFDLYAHVKDSAVKNNILRIHVQTSVAYALYVNKYKTSQVRHKGKRIKYRGRTIVLQDPLAIGGFFDKMVIFAIKIILFHLVKIKRKYSAKTRLKYAEMKIIKLW